MKSWGIYLIIFGLLAIILPYFNYQLMLLSFTEGNEIVIGGAFIAVGALLTFLGIKAEKGQ